MAIVRSGFLRAFAIVAASALFVERCHAGTVLDQSFDPTVHATVRAELDGLFPTQERAQTFKVGIAGDLVRVDVFAEAFSTTGNLILDIRSAFPSGTPDPSPTPLGVLATATVAARDMPVFPTGAFVTFELDRRIAVLPGQIFAIDLHASPTAQSSRFGWLGSNDGSYLNGTDFERMLPNHNWAGEHFDLGFRTFVATVPLPQIAWAGIVLLAGVASMRVMRRVMQ